MPALDQELVHWRNMLNGSVFDDHIDASEFARRLLDQAHGIGRLGEIGSSIGHAHVIGRGNFLAQLLDSGGSAEAVVHEIGPPAASGRGLSEFLCAGRLMVSPALGS
jgi:hypothetical protein